MCWVTFDRAARIARDCGPPAPLDEWQKISARIYRNIMDKGWDEKARSFVQYYGDKVIDARALLLALTGSSKPRMEAIMHVPNVHRYGVEKGTNDGLEGHEGTLNICSFNICSFWLVEDKRGQDGWRRHGSPSNICSPMPIASACKLKKSLRRACALDGQFPQTFAAS
jgi:GH15 family glucan-1,4-alpha-glucosidase